MSERLWSVEFPEALILDLLAQKQGALLDKELFLMLKELTRGLTFKDFMKALMKLELWGYIRVTRYKKTSNMVQLLKPP